MRKYILTIDGKTFETPDPDEKDPEKQYALDIRFDISFPSEAGGACRSGTIAILGLSEKMRNRFLELSTLSGDAAFAKQLSVDLAAGYDDGRFVRVFSGYAYGATTSAPPDMWLNLQVQEFNASGGKVVKFTKLAKKGVKYKIGKLAEELIGNFEDSNGNKIGFVDLTTGKKNVGSQTIASFGSGNGYNIKSAVIAINDMSKDWTVVLRGNSLYAYPNEISFESGKDSSADLTVVDNPLSVTGINVKNATITVFLSEGCLHHGRLKLVSKLNPQANGTYRVTNKRFIGHYQGNEWYTQYTCTDRIKDSDGKDSGK